MPPIKDVFLLTYDHPEEGRIIYAIFTTRQKARAFQKTMQERCGLPEDTDIEVWSLNPTVPPPPKENWNHEFE